MTYKRDGDLGLALVEIPSQPRMVNNPRRGCALLFQDPRCCVSSCDNLVRGVIEPVWCGDMS
jgi:hypothetical protein